MRGEGGVAHVDFPLALDDERCLWKIVAEDALTGLCAERELNVDWIPRLAGNLPPHAAGVCAKRGSFWYTTHRRKGASQWSRFRLAS